jgi:hypothetical protein
MWIRYRQPLRFITAFMHMIDSLAYSLSLRTQTNDYGLVHCSRMGMQGMVLPDSLM